MLLLLRGGGILDGDLVKSLRGRLQDGTVARITLPTPWYKPRNKARSRAPLDFV